MNKYLIFCAITFVSSAFITSGMQVSQKKAEIQKKITSAFKTFDILAENCEIETEEHCPSCIQDKTMRHWSGGPKCVWLSRQIQDDPCLTEFAALYIAAKTKNNYINKDNYSFFSAWGATLILACMPIFYTMDHILEPPRLPIDNANLYLLKTAGKFFASFIPLGLLSATNTIHSMIDNTLMDYFDTQTFTLACQKLIEQNNLKPLATYYAFAKLVEHRPLCQTTQLCIIQWILKNNDLSITASRTSHNSAQAHIWKDSSCISKGHYWLPASTEEVNLADSDTSDNMSVSWNNA